MNGLKELPKDDRDFKMGAVYSLPALSELPPSFKLTDSWITDQKDSDFCSAFATVGASMLQEGIPLAPEISFALSKVISGDPDEYGQDLRTACQVHVKFGALDAQKSPFTLENRSFEELRKIENWGDLSAILDQMVVHKKRTYLSLGGHYSPFDEIRASIWKFRDEKRAVVFGTIWDAQWSLSQIQMDNVPKNGGGHAMRIIGWDGDYAIVKNSYGQVTPNAEHRFHRSIIDAMVNKYGAFMFVDLSPEEVKRLLDKGIKVGEEGLLQVLIALFTSLKKKLFPNSVGNVPSPFLIPALVWQESEGNVNAVGDKDIVDHAYGPLQIRNPYMHDVFPWRSAAECLNNLPLSLAVFHGYMNRYCTKKALGREPTDQDMARIHNGGPSGWKRNSTLIYWTQVQNKMKRLQSGNVPQIIKDRLLALHIL